MRVPVTGIFYGDIRGRTVPVAPVYRCARPVHVKNKPVLRMWLVLLDETGKDGDIFRQNANAVREIVRTVRFVR
ncbi:hypothetical protein A8C60_25205 [Escherichia coli]|nr:hypothetical protein A8C60_25205 [Escherichia coli]GCX15688.1 hypothetical protein HmCmsJML082_03535 [Escherichia coli]